MAKAPAFQMYVRDWLVDTERLSLAAQGAWMRICCNLHLESPRGELTLPLAGWGGIMGCGTRRARRLLEELDVTGTSHVTFGDDGVTVQCRRMVRERNDKEASRLSTARWREKAGCDADVIPPSSSSASSSASAQPEEVEEGARARKIGFAFEGEKQGFKGIEETDKAAWRTAYPAVDIDGEILRAEQWQLSNPDKRKKNYRRFLTNWFGRSQERGGSRHGPTQAGSRQQRQPGGAQDGAEGGEGGKYGDGESLTA